MIRKSILKSSLSFATCLFLVACNKGSNPTDGAPPPANIILSGNAGLLRVDNPNAFVWPRQSSLKLIRNCASPEP